MLPRVLGSALLSTVLCTAQLELSGSVNGRSFTVAGATYTASGVSIEAVDTPGVDAGATKRVVHLRNTTQRPATIERLPSLRWRLPAGRYTLHYLWGGWGQERQLANEPLGAGTRSFVSDRGRSSALYSPWFYLRNESTGTGYIAQLAWSGNWELSFRREPGRADEQLESRPVIAEMGMRFDGGSALTLPVGDAYELPAAVFATVPGDLNAATNVMHRYQRAFVFPKSKVNSPPLVQFNSWYPFQGKVNVAEMKRYAEAAAELGAEVFMLDAGWYNKKNWVSEIGDWTPDPVAFPKGLEELADFVRQRGMKFGLWVEIENGGTDSQLIRQHPEWFFPLNGKPLLKGERYHLNFAKPEVRAWAKATVDRLVKSYGLEWIKIDYNIDIGDQFDQPASGRRGDVLAAHIRAYYSWLDEIRAAHPALMVENCSSGGLRFDLGILAHTHTTWLSDVVTPKPSAQLAYGCTVEFAPEVCNHWMVGDKDNGSVETSTGREWWDYMFRIAMNGQFGISSRVFDWTAEQRKRAAEHVAEYKRIRTLIAAADVYHLTPAPNHQAPTGSMAIEYTLPDRSRSVVLAFALGGAPPEMRLRMRGLDPAATYGVSVDDAAPVVQTGAQLMSAGLAVARPEWSSAVIYIERR